jgi:hypothetical protein
MPPWNNLKSRRYLQFYPVFDRFHMKCFLHLGLMHWGYAPRICVIDNTNLARWRGLGANAVMVPVMEAFGRGYGFRFLCHAPKHSDCKAWPVSAISLKLLTTRIDQH